MQALAHGVVGSCVFGPVHLLRLLCKLPQLMPMAQVKDDERAIIEQQLSHLIAFLKEHHSTLFQHHVPGTQNSAHLLQEVAVET